MISQMDRKISVLLADDHAVVRAGYRILLMQSDRIDKIFEVQSGEEACQVYLEQNPGVVVMDLSMPGIGGLDAIRRIRAKDANARILVFSIHDELVFVSRAIQAGATGYISKRSAPEILVDAVLALASGGTYVEAEIDRKMSRHATKINSSGILDGLSAREFDVFTMLARGLTVREIADELCLSPKTVANYHTSVKSKLGVNTSAEIARLAIQNGLS